ncbi:MAG: transcriptional regulator GlxA family with amidase domain [Flavobacterium sp.]|jgi:transcriptional regulator GlxA family with amidase domain
MTINVTQKNTQKPESSTVDLRIGFVLSPDFTLTPLAGFIDTLRLASEPLAAHTLYSENSPRSQATCQWSLLSHSLAPCYSSCGISITPDAVYSSSDQFDYIVLVAGRIESLPKHNPATFDYLHTCVNDGIPLIGLCTAAFVFAEMGLMEGRRCAVHFAIQREFFERYSDSVMVSDESIVIDNNIITCPDSIAAIDVAAYLVNRHCGQARAHKAVNYLRSTATTTPSLFSARPTYEHKLSKAKSLTVEAVRIMELNIDNPFSISEVAKLLNTSTGKLNRIFQQDMGDAPAGFWREIRLVHARRLILDSRKQITEIAYETGFCDSAHFCKVFAARYQTSPMEYRRLRLG